MTDTIVKGMTHREMIDIMTDAGIFCSVDKFAKVLVDVQRLAYDQGFKEGYERRHAEVLGALA